MKQAASSRSVLQAVARPIAGAAVVVLCAAILAASMTKQVSRDEQMYCTAGALLAQGKMIYRDFSYPAQLPYHPLLLAALYRGLGTTQYLLVGRLVSAVCDILVLIVILAIYRRVFASDRVRGWLFGLAAAALYVFNPLVDYALGYAWNHDVVILLVVASLWLFLTTDFEHKARFWRVGLMGALLTVATFMRVTTVLVELLFLAALLLSAGGSFRNRSLTALPFSLAALTVAIWPLWIIAQAPQAFRLNLVRIPSLYGRWLHETGIVYGKLTLTADSLLTPGYIVFLILVFYCIGMAWRRSLDVSARERRNVRLTALLPALFFFIAYIPPTMWPQYLAVPVPFLAIALACPLAGLARKRENRSDCRETGRPGSPCRVASWLVGVGAFVVIVANPVVLYRCLAIFVPEAWTPVTLHGESQDIAADVGEPRLVLTLGPLYAIEGGCDIYPELACGDIIYRVADLMSPDERQITHTVGPETLDELVKTRPPAAIIVGVEPSYFSTLEDPLRRLAPPDWPRKTRKNGLQVYIRP
jgi:hypothetical protein